MKAGWVHSTRLVSALETRHKPPLPFTIHQGLIPTQLCCGRTNLAAHAGPGRRIRMKFTKLGKALMMSALSAGLILGISSCVQSYTVGYLYVTGTVTAQSGNNGI